MNCFKTSKLYFNFFNTVVQIRGKETLKMILIVQIRGNIKNLITYKQVWGKQSICNKNKKVNSIYYRFPTVKAVAKMRVKHFSMLS